MSIGLLTRLDYENALGHSSSIVLNVSPNLNYFLVDKKNYKLALEPAFGYSLWSGQLKDNYFSPIASINYSFFRSGFNYSLTTKNYFHIKSNFGILASLSYLNNHLSTPPNIDGTTIIGSGKVKTSDILLNIGLFFKRHKVNNPKGLR